ncbi:exo-alpha-sialidase [Myxococcota bacterium]|nr:exo-alpha-sialidase [Myxococcota bacterium]
MRLWPALLSCTLFALACGGTKTVQGDDVQGDATAPRGKAEGKAPRVEPPAGGGAPRGQADADAPATPGTSSAGSAGDDAIVSVSLPLGSAATSMRTTGRGGAVTPDSAPPGGGPPPGAGAPPRGKAGKAGGGPPPQGGGGPPPGAGGGSAGAGASNPVSAAFNNANVLARTADGTVHMLFAMNGEVRYRRKGPDGSTKETTFGTSRAPALATDGESTVLVVWSDASGLMAAMSSDGGKTFGKSATIAAGRGQNPAAHLWREGGKLKGAVVWHEDVGPGSGGRGAAKGVFGLTMDEGRFSAPTRLDGSAVEAAFATVHGGPQGVVVLWRERQTQGGERSIYLSELQAGRFGKGRRLASGLDPSACVDGKGNVHVGYQNEYKETWYMRSEDGGRTFSSPMQLDHAGLFVRVACNADGQVALAWEHFNDPQASFADDSSKGLGLASSLDGGRTWRVHDPTGGETGLALTTCALDDDGRMDLLWVRDGREVVTYSTDLDD